MTAVVPFVVLAVLLAAMVWLFRGLAIGLLVQSAERGTIIPMSLTLARVGVPGGDTFVLGVPARRSDAPWHALGTLVLTSRRLRWTRRGTVEDEVLLSQVEHLTVRNGRLQITRRDRQPPLELRVAQPALIARYVQVLATRPR